MRVQEISGQRIKAKLYLDISFTKKEEKEISCVFEGRLMGAEPQRRKEQRAEQTGFWVTAAAGRMLSSHRDRRDRSKVAFSSLPHIRVIQTS